jgi:DNA processing protein
MDGDRALRWLHLHRLAWGAARPLNLLLERFAGLDGVYAAPRTALTDFFSRSETVDELLRGPAAADLAPEQAWLARPDNHLVVITDPAYPAMLREIRDPPPLLFVHGDPAVLAAPQLAVIGSRNPTTGGCETARAFTQTLVESGLVITSGLAVGIDACAHAAAIEAGGRTIAVCGTGLDRVYPASHLDLAHAIGRHGALVSELPLGSAPKREHFPLRNRIIAGLSLGTLVVEAALRSGSLITARLAGDSGREVFAIPGSIHSPLARGCHRLIRQGAKLVETAQDILEELGPLAHVALAGAAPARPAVSDEESALLHHLGFDPVDLDTLVARSGLTVEGISAMLLAMELRGLVEVCPGGRFRRMS